MADEQSTSSDDRNPERCVLTDRLLRALTWNGKRVGPDGTLIAGTKGDLKNGQRRVVWDAWVDESGFNTGLCVKISQTGAKTFCVTRRVAGALRPTKFTIGRYDRGDVTLADARKKALEVVAQMRSGVRPTTRREEIAQRRLQEQEAKLAKLRETEHTVKAVVEAFIKAKTSKMRSGSSIEGVLNREIVPRFGHLPITDVTRKMVSGMLHDLVADESKRRGGAVAHAAIHAFAAIRSLYKWAIAQDKYDIENSPCTHVSAKTIIDPNSIRKPRERILDDGEVRAFMAATSALLTYPWGPMYRLLFMTGCRLREIAHVRWDEIGVATVIDEKTRAEVHVDVLTIPASRMKGKRDHVVPLTDQMMDLLGNVVPRFERGGPYIFSTSAGHRPISGFGHGKNLLDRAMKVVRPELQPFWNHDLRRTARSLLSAAGVSPDHAERVIAHKIGGVRGIYDRHEFLLEKRAALEALAAKVGRIVDPAPTNVVQLQRAAAQ